MVSYPKEPGVKTRDIKDTYVVKNCRERDW